MAVLAAAISSNGCDLNRECISAGHIADGTCRVCGVT